MIPVVDLFAGPGGLNEGFSRLGEDLGKPRFRTVASFEMDSAACATLTLRGVYREAIRTGSNMSQYLELLRGNTNLRALLQDEKFARAWERSATHVHQIELGPTVHKKTDALIRAALTAQQVQSDKPWILIGGPPCQAYSLAGRSRRVNDEQFEDDKKHFLYREYLRIIAGFAPPVFVMENVKGLLSSKNAGMGMFDQIRRDLSTPRKGLRYELHSLAVRRESGEYTPSDFVLRAEEYGVPQRRHRVILVGVRSDLVAGVPRHLGLLERARHHATVREAIGGLPPLRSALSKGDSQQEWARLLRFARSRYPLEDEVALDLGLLRGGPFVRGTTPGGGSKNLERWLRSERLGGFVQHETRTHMPDDLLRYWFAAAFAMRTGYSPSLRDFPSGLLPKHANVNSDNRPFEDRFRVQTWDSPSTTVVSHIAKDGHYYIHPDPTQMRSLTVREAARLQTFQDNYYFCGTRTQQFTQVGNAVPPLLANQIAEVLATFLDTALG